MTRESLFQGILIWVAGLITLCIICGFFLSCNKQQIDHFERMKAMDISIALSNTVHSFSNGLERLK